jgi:hypothetical protein
LPVTQTKEEKDGAKEMADRRSFAGTGDGGVAAIIAGSLVVALVVVGFFFYFGVNGAPSTIIDLDAPATTVSVAPTGQ